MTDKAELVVTALQQRIGEIVSNYETQIAVLRAEITLIIDQNQERENEFLSLLLKLHLNQI